MQTFDIAVVGAGPAGSSAAAGAASQGASVVLIDEQNGLGGHLRWTLDRQQGPPDEIDGKLGFEIVSWAAADIEESGVQVELNAVAWGLFEDNVLGIARGDEAFQVKANAIIVATGSTDIVWPFRGWDLPGVMTARAARKMMNLHRILPGRNFLLIGSDTRCAQLAEDIRMAGGNVLGTAPSPDGIVAGGEGQVEWVEVDGARTDADTVVMAFGEIPDPELARHALSELEYDHRCSAHVAKRSDSLETTTPGVYVIGHAAGNCKTAEALAEGVVAFHSALGSDELGDMIQRLNTIRANAGTNGTVAPQFDPAAIPDDVLVDREEQVTAGEIRQAISEGTVTLNDVKRRTRAGMGISQGRDTEYVIARMINAQAGVPLESLLPMTARPPARPISIEALASLASRTD
ncbi:MAG: FAD-dependent oxidoreductase [Chloroflexota bacterium]